MKKKFLAIVLFGIICFSMVACGGRQSEEARLVQRKIDKALESEPTYEDIVEIIELYDDLLMDEQKTIKNYDKIEAMNEIDSNVVSCIYASYKLSNLLKNPNSLALVSAYCYDDGENVAIKLGYSAANDLGGMVDGEYYCLIETPVEENESWTIRLDEEFEARLNLELLDSVLGTSRNSADSQEIAKDAFDKVADKAIKINVYQITNNLSVPIHEIVRQ